MPNSLKILLGSKQKMENVDELTNSLDSLGLVEKKIINKGTGAGGAKTNENGKNFEDLTNNETMLISMGFVKKIISKNKYGYYLSKNFEDIEVIFVLQGGLIQYMKKEFGIELFRHPDEAYIFKNNNNTILKIIEKKNQNVVGSVDTKLWAAPSLKREYELVCGENFDIQYILYLSDWFKSQKSEKYIYLRMILKEANIKILYKDTFDLNKLIKID